MATKNSNKNSETPTLVTLKNKAGKIHDVALKASNDLVEETIATGEQWQNLLAKAIQKGTTLFGKQQELALTSLETLKEQALYGKMRLNKLVSSKTPKNKTAPKSGPTKRNTSEEIAQLLDEPAKAEAPTKKATTPAPAKTAKKPMAKAKIPAPAKAVKKPIADPFKKTPSTSATKPADLTLIEGIGPKIKELLTKAGISNLEQLAAANPADVKKSLTDAGPRYKMHDPSSWTAQAKLAAAGKMDELKALQAELKGGK